MVSEWSRIVHRHLLGFLMLYERMARAFIVLHGMGILLFPFVFDISGGAFSRQCMAREMWCSAAIFLRFKMAYLMRPNEVLMLTPVVSAISLKLMSW